MTIQEKDLAKFADRIYEKTRHYLTSILGRLSHEANDDEIFCALSYAMREEIMANWMATSRTYAKCNTRIVYYISMEYLPGRILNNNITNLHSMELVKAVLKKFDRKVIPILEREHDPALGNGGLGRLASCFLDTLATLQYPAQGYGLRYQYGIFEQQIWNGEQVEAPDIWLTEGNPWEFQRDLRRVTVRFSGEISPRVNAQGEEVWDLSDYQQVWARPSDIPIIGYCRKGNFTVTTLRLWSTRGTPRNFQLQRYNAGRLDEAAENIILTDVLYPSDHHDTGMRIRLKQEFLLVSASLQDIIRHYLASHSTLDSFADKVRIQINDTHPALVIAELIRTLTEEYDFSWSKAVEVTRTVTSYTNHTILREALEEWDRGLVYTLLPRQTKVIERLNHDFCYGLRKQFPGNEELVRRVSIIEGGRVRMAHLAIIGSHKINGVSGLHTEILKKRVFKDFYNLYPEKFVNVTNGVTQRRWLLLCNPLLSQFITERIGEEWIVDFTKISQLAGYAADPASQEAFLAIKRQNKQQLIDYIHTHNCSRNAQGVPSVCLADIDVNSLFSVQAKRIHEYKRQLMNALHLIMLYRELLDQPYHNRIKRTVIFAGKAPAQYETAKGIIRLINCIARKIVKEPRVNEFLKVVFIENYNVTRAEMIIPAADLSEQLSVAGAEASGTGNMKFSMNGALTIATDDGANIEMREAIGNEWWPFMFGASAEEVAKMHDEESYQPRDFLEDPEIFTAVEALRDHSFAESPEEHEAFCDLYEKLIVSRFGGPPDPYCQLYDLRSYYEMQKKVELLFQDQKRWAEVAIHNIAGMGRFSGDVSIQNYCEKIWEVAPCPVDRQVLSEVRKEFAEHLF